MSFQGASKPPLIWSKSQMGGKSQSEIAQRLDRTLLACEAMWSILREKLDVTDEELVCSEYRMDALHPSV